MIEGRKWHVCDSFTNTDGDTIVVVTDGQFGPDGPNVEILNLSDENPTWMEGFENSHYYYSLSNHLTFQDHLYQKT